MSSSFVAQTFFAHVMYVQMVLIYPQIVVNASDVDGGRVVISFPEDSDCETFAIPLRPSEGRLKTWKRSIKPLLPSPIELT